MGRDGSSAALKLGGRLPVLGEGEAEEGVEPWTGVLRKEQLVGEHGEERLSEKRREQMPSRDK